MRIRLLAAASLLWIALPLASAAQVELALGGGGGTFTGADFAGGDAGPTVGVGVYFPFLGAFQGGAVFDYSVYGRTGLEGDAKQKDFLAVARYVTAREPLRFFGGAKLGVSRQSFSVAGEPATAEGFVIGPTGGVQLRFGTLGVEVTGDALYHTYEELVVYTRREHGTDADGFRFVVRAGVVILVR